MRVIYLLLAIMLAGGIVVAQETSGSDKSPPPNIATDYAMAKIAFKRAVDANPQDAYSWSQLGRLHYWDQEWNAALYAFDQYLLLAPGDLEVEVARARTIYNMRRYSESADAFYDLLDREELTEGLRAQVLAGYALSLDRCGAAEAACYWYEQALEANPDDIELRIAFATNLSGQNQHDAAFGQLNMILERDPENEAALVGIARIYSWMGDYEQALCFIDMVDCDGPYGCPAILARAYTYFYMGERSKAYDEVRRYQGNCDQSDPDAGTLYAMLTEVDEPYLEALWKQWEDSDDNDYTGWTTTLHYPVAANGEKMEVIYEDFHLDNSDQGLRTSGARTQFNYIMPLNDRLKVTARLWHIKTDNNLSPSHDRWNVAPSFDYKVNREWYVHGGYANYYLTDTAQLAANGITLEDYTLGTRHTLFGNDNTWALVEFSRGKYSDNNERNQWIVDVYRDHEIDDQGILRAGIAGKYLDFKINTNSGYFDPDKYAFTEAYLGWRDTSDNTLKLEGTVGFGVEKIAGQSAQEVFRFKAGMYTDFPESPLTLRAGYFQSDAATTQGGTAGYKIKEWYFGADVEF